MGEDAAILGRGSEKVRFVVMICKVAMTSGISLGEGMSGRRGKEKELVSEKVRSKWKVDKMDWNKYGWRKKR